MWGLIAVFSADMALEACQPIVHPVHGSELEPDPEKPEPMTYCHTCAEEVAFDELKSCLQCGHDGCKNCMYYNRTSLSWFCITTGPSGLAKGQVESECFAEYLGVAEIIISRKE